MNLRLLGLLTGLTSASCLAVEPINLATNGQATTSNYKTMPSHAIDGDSSTKWYGAYPGGELSLTIQFPSYSEVSGAKVVFGPEVDNPPDSFALQIYMNGRWSDIVRRDLTSFATITEEFEAPILTDKFRLSLFGGKHFSIREFEIIGAPYAADVSQVRDALINQSGYNLGQPKRFTAPKHADGTVFQIVNQTSALVVFSGSIEKHIGDFSAFNPETSDEFVIKIGETKSFPFRIGPYWLERVTYQNMNDFMTGARHYVGTTKEIRTFSWEWRDGDFFNWALQTLVAQYLANPVAHERLARNISYVENSSYPIQYAGLWGQLAPYDESAPDIVKLIHWDADIKLSQSLEHEHQKAELAHFLYAFPYLKKWLPQQNFDAVYAYAKQIWDKPDVRPNSTTKYDRSEGHNLLAIKTKLGSNKGELPPGASVIPNLMMYEVAETQGESDAEKYFDAAFRQMEWMITHLDWHDPMTTKGQRMSEHITMRAFAYFHQVYPHRAPPGLTEKVTEWVKVALNRSHNMWDFRKYTDHDEWAPLGWNETGNILGFPAAALSAKSVLSSAQLRAQLDILVWSHLDNAFGRNPLGRHSSYDGPREIEGVDLGWFNAYEGGIGLLEPVRFVFDGSPKAEHFPNHPELGNFGWTEGWVQFNIAFNTSMAYLAFDEVEISLVQSQPKNIAVRLKAPLNFDENTVDKVDLQLRNSRGETFPITLQEEGRFSKYLSANVSLRNGKLHHGDQSIAASPGEEITVSYGLGYFAKTAALKIP